MKQYHDVMRNILENGSWNGNRTKHRTIGLPSAYMQFDMNDGFPAVTTKKLAFKSAMAEVIGYLRAYTSAADFRALGTKTWDANANENDEWLANPYREGTDHLGPGVYGTQWRRWPAYKTVDSSSVNAQVQIEHAKAQGYEVLTVIERLEEGGKTYTTLLHKQVDQLRECMDKILAKPGDRRMIFHSWNVAQLDECALPSCPSWWQFSCDASKNELSMSTLIRSSDAFLGLAFNLAQMAMLLHLVSRLTGRVPKMLSVTLVNPHIYETHLSQVREQLTREEFPLPKLVISDRVPEYAKTGVYEPQWLDLVEPSDFALEGYQHHGVLTGQMAV